MGWVFLEVLVALAIAAVLVWWTMPRKRGGESEGPNDGEGPPRG